MSTPANKPQQYYGLVGPGSPFHMIEFTDCGDVYTPHVLCGAVGEITLLPVTGSDGGAWCVRCVRAQLAR